jgi:phenylalanine-4-hydroxylase
VSAAPEPMNGLPTTYSEQDHDTWATVLDAYLSRLDAVACTEVIDGFERLGLSHRICDLAELSDRVEGLCGWRLEPVGGLVSGADFVALLNSRRYPITAHMRAPEEAEFSRLPDLFHDVVGHVPLLVHRPYTEFLEHFAAVLATYSSSAAAVTALGRFYWYTTEIGLASDVDRPKVFGAAILTSSAECSRAVAPDTTRVPFDLDEAGRTSYDIYQMQERYFVAESLAQLVRTGPQLEEWARRMAIAP